MFKICELWTVNCDIVIWTLPSGPLCLWQCLFIDGSLCWSFQQRDGYSNVLFSGFTLALSHIHLTYICEWVSILYKVQFNSSNTSRVLGTLAILHGHVIIMNFEMMTKPACNRGLREAIAWAGRWEACTMFGWLLKIIIVVIIIVIIPTKIDYWKSLSTSLIMTILTITKTTEINCFTVCFTIPRKWYLRFSKVKSYENNI